MAITWNSVFKTKPIGSKSGSLLDNYIRETREATEERILKEHEMLNSVTPSLDGTHKRGSARCFVSDTAPTVTVMEDEDGADGDRAIGRQWYQPSKGQMYIWDGTSWMPIGYFYGQVVWATEGTYLPDGFVACTAEAIYSDGTRTVHVPNLSDKFVRGGVGYSGGWTTGGQATVTLEEENLPEHTHGMDHEHKSRSFNYDDEGGLGGFTGVVLTQKDSPTAKTLTTGFVTDGPIEPGAAVGSAGTEKTETDATGSGTAFDNNPEYVELKAYCFTGGLSAI